jgi:hypothetical protein
MLTAVMLTMALAAPAVTGPSLHPDRRELGSLWYEQGSTFAWPGLYMPAFTLVPDRRQIHRFTLGLDLPALRWLEFEALTVEPSNDPDLRRLTARMPTGEGSNAYAYAGVRVHIPQSRWQLGIGRSMAIAGAGAMARGMVGRGSLWQVNLVRPLR